MDRETALQNLSEAQAALGHAFEAYAMALCSEGKPGLASEVASAMGKAREAFFDSLSTRDHKRPAFTLVKPCASYSRGSNG